MLMQWTQKFEAAAALPGKGSFSSGSSSFRLLWSCKSRLVHKISFVWSLFYFEFMVFSVDF
jgi:hypothetical protein